MILQRTTALRELVKDKTYYMIGSLLFAFTVFWAYISFSQYFIIWNANMPEETFWYVLREQGTWWFTGAIMIIFGHFFIPFLARLQLYTIYQYLEQRFGVVARSGASAESRERHCSPARLRVSMKSAVSAIFEYG